MKTEPHKHSGYFEIIYLLEGAGAHVIDSVKYEVRPQRDRPNHAVHQKAYTANRRQTAAGVPNVAVQQDVCATRGAGGHSAFSGAEANRVL